MGDIVTILFCFSLLPVVVYSHNDCPISRCSKRGLTVKFPFRIESDQPIICGFPGFNLRCSDQGVPTLNLPNSGDFLVRDINYSTQELQLYDPSNCLPQRLLSLTLSSSLLSPSSLNSTFNALNYQNYTFLRCPREAVKPGYSIIECLSNSTSAVLATSSVALAKSMNMCDIYANLPIPTYGPVPYEDRFTSDLSADLHLKWDFPDCKSCESQGHICGFRSDTDETIICYNPKKGKSKRLATYWSLMVIFVILPNGLVAIGILYCLLHCLFACLQEWWIILRARRNTRASTIRSLQSVRPVSSVQLASPTAQSMSPTAAAPRPNTGTTDTGNLPESGKYTKIVFGQSEEPLPGPSHVTCSICLADYRPNEAIGCLRGCEHCFHATCIDEWLRTKSTCPICRAYPPTARGNR